MKKIYIIQLQKEEVNCKNNNYDNNVIENLIVLSNYRKNSFILF